MEEESVRRLRSSPGGRDQTPGLEEPSPHQGAIGRCPGSLGRRSPTPWAQSRPDWRARAPQASRSPSVGGRD